MGLPQVWLDGKTMGNFSKSQQWLGQDKQLSNCKSYLQQNNFNRQRFPADGILIPHLQ
jgi:hypothetical protein